MGKLWKTWLVNKILDNFVHSSDTPVDEDLKKFIFNELKEKAGKATDLEQSKQLSSHRGELALERNSDMLWTVNKVELVESILLWHIATDLCYEDGKEEVKDQDENVKKAVQVQVKISKVISEYMVYLLVLKPSMISSIEGIRQIKFRDACEETLSIIKTKKLKAKAAVVGELRSLVRDVFDGPNKFERTGLVLFDACYLYQILSNDKNIGRRWEIITKVWAELLAYAASNCRGNYHAKCLSTGGELLTHVWFLMAHLGLGQQYHVVSSHANAKVIVEK